MELSSSTYFFPDNFVYDFSKYRKIYFFDDEGRGLIIALMMNMKKL